MENAISGGVDTTFDVWPFTIFRISGEKFKILANLACDWLFLRRRVCIFALPDVLPPSFLSPLSFFLSLSSSLCETQRIEEEERSWSWNSNEGIILDREKAIEFRGRRESFVVEEGGNRILTSDE